MLRRPPRSTLFPYTTLLPISPLHAAEGQRPDQPDQAPPQGEVRLASTALHADALPIHGLQLGLDREDEDRKSTRLNSSHANISYAVFCLKKKKITPHR